ncbi:ATP-dependent helicase/deoxyribonuclease subunit B [Sedimentisphaera cyanobacteriorum]|uniref:ATP-dependent helicase/deoxyribonuclease subunit B n=1 Tax=Sedimentisphaera cyanobacteriorum TaxID=1940790 RepID=A0A1Q2HR66_9BACT|nr:PD-(D/E)XK nuclease family protein [Sedimentisphaera cyanobacteriorum]AQQ09959.1 ATP-dependent helicase/deoxyribonuclease subunit B [Sedimentisphaera cyanobacteriorum]
MNIRFITGRSGAGKTRLCIEEIVSLLEDKNDSRKLIFLVPEQASYQMEEAVLKRCSPQAYNKLSVVSFSRLSYWILRENRTLETISKSAKRMILLRILQQNSDRLSIFSDISSSRLNAEELEKLIDEFYASDLSPLNLKTAAENLREKQNLYTYQKFSDIAFIYDEFTKFIHNRYRDPDAYLTELVSEIPESSFAENSLIWVDGFSGFSAAERDVLKQLAARAEQTAITFCADPQNPSNPVFSPSNNTLAQLEKDFQKAGGFNIEYVKLSSGGRWINGSEELRKLEESLAADRQVLIESETVKTANPESIRDEVVIAAEKIVSMAAAGEMNFEDIGIITPKISKYQRHLREVFADYGIPLFIDKNQPLQDDVFAKCILTALAFISSGLKTYDLSAYLKNPCSPADFDTAVSIENKLMKTGVQSEALLGSIRNYPQLEPLFNFAELWRNSRKISIEEFTQAVKSFISYHSCLAPEQSRLFTEAAEKILREMNIAFSGFASEFAEFLNIFRSEAVVCNTGKIPAERKEVTAGDVSRARKPELKALFIMGALRGDFPACKPQEGVLSELDRQNAADEGLDIPQPMKEMAESEKYLNYIALTRASERLFVSFPSASEEGPADILKSLAGQNRRPAKNYTALCELRIPSEVLQERLSALIASERLSLADAAGQLESLEVFQRAASWSNSTELSAETVRSFYKGKKDISVSALQDYAKCPFMFFCGRLLGIEAKRFAAFDPLEQGSFIHKVMDSVSKRLLENGQGFDCPASDLLCLADDCIKKLLEAGSEFQAADRHSEFVLNTLKENAKDLVLLCGKMASLGSFKLASSEKKFSSQTNSIKLYEDSELSIYMEGFIDRCDLYEHPSRGKLALALDYKLSNYKRDLSKIIHGLDIQLPLYCKALEKMGFPPAGFLYVGTKPQSGCKISIEQIQDRQVKIFKTSGFINESFWRCFENLGEGESSDVFNLKVKKDGNLAKNTDVLSPGHFKELLNMSLETAERIAAKIAEADIKITPASIKGSLPCEYCNFRPVCRYEELFNSPKILTGVSRVDDLKIILNERMSKQ